MNLDQPAKELKYWAFISYSSKDRRWGQWLHKRLENYTIPKEFQGTELFDGAVLGKNLRPIFRDRDELSGSSDLGPAIAIALEQTRYLIVLCSKNSAKSEWVNKEIEDFKALGREKNILALILDGEPNATSNNGSNDSAECFPPALRYPAEPLAGDLRKEGDGKERGFLKVLSGIAQLDFDILYRRHERQQRKRRQILGALTTAVVLTLTGLTTFAFNQRKEAVLARNDANQELASALLFQSQAAIVNEQFHDALPPLIRASDLFVELGNTPPELARLLQLAVDGNHLLRDFKPHSERVDTASFSKDGSVLLTMSSLSDEVGLWDTTTWKPILFQKLDNLRQAVLSRESDCLITLQEHEDESQRLAQTHWKRWSIKDGSLLDSKELQGWSIDDLSMEEGVYNTPFPVSNLYSRTEDDQYTLRFYSIESNQLETEIPLPDSARFSTINCFPEANILLLCQQDKVLALHYPSGQPMTELQDVAGFSSNETISSDHRKLFARNDGGREWGIWDLQTGKRLHTGENNQQLFLDLDGKLFGGDVEESINILNTHDFPATGVDSLGYSSEQREKVSASLATDLIATAGFNNVEIEQISTGTSHYIPATQRDIASLTMHPGSNRLVTFDDIGRAQVHEILNKTIEDVPSLKELKIVPIETNPVAEKGLYRTENNELIIWDTAGERIVSTMLGANDKKYFDHEWHPGIHRLVTHSADKVGFNDPDPPTLRVYDTSSGEKLLELLETWPQKLSPNGSSLLVVKNETFSLHPLDRSGQAVDLLDPALEDAYASAYGFSPDGKTIAFAASHGRVVLHNCSDGKLLREFDLSRAAEGIWTQHSFSNLIFNPAGTKILVASNMESSYLIDLSTGTVSQTADLQIEHGSDYQFHQEGSLLVCPSYDEVKLWSFPELELTTNIRSGADHLFLYPDESLFLAWNDYDDCLLGNLETGIETQTYTSPIAISPEHGLIATHDDGTLNILNFRTNKVLRSTPADSADDGLFSPDGRTLYFVDDDNALKKFTFHQQLPALLQRARMEAPHP